jgi:hypothetical protein
MSKAVYVTFEAEAYKVPRYTHRHHLLTFR